MVQCNGEHCHLDGKLIPYREFVGEHLEVCRAVKMGCPRLCDHSLVFKSREEARAHYEVCPKALVDCKRCDESFERA